MLLRWEVSIAASSFTAGLQCNIHKGTVSHNLVKIMNLLFVIAIIPFIANKNNLYLSSVEYS